MCPQLSLPEWQGTKIPLVAEMEKKKTLGESRLSRGTSPTLATVLL